MVAVAELLDLPRPQRLERVDGEHERHVPQPARDQAGHVGVPGVAVDDVGVDRVLGHRERALEGIERAGKARVGVLARPRPSSGSRGRAGSASSTRCSPKQRTSTAIRLRQRPAQVLDVDAGAAIDVGRVLVGEQQRLPDLGHGRPPLGSSGAPALEPSGGRASGRRARRLAPASSDADLVEMRRAGPPGPRRPGRRRRAPAPPCRSRRTADPRRACARAAPRACPRRCRRPPPRARRRPRAGAPPRGTDRGRAWRAAPDRGSRSARPRARSSIAIAGPALSIRPLVAIAQGAADLGQAREQAARAGQRADLADPPLDRPRYGAPAGARAAPRRARARSRATAPG